jgi:predicted RNA-binding Zn-ribbon protein involved in translation (DUF1610 family)
MAKQYFMSQGGKPVRVQGAPMAFACPSCGHNHISVQLDVDEEPYGFKAKAECDKCGALGPTARSRDLGIFSQHVLVEREAAKRWNAMATRIGGARNSVLEAIRQLKEVLATIDEKSQLGLYLADVLQGRLDPAADELAPDPSEGDPVTALPRAA